MRDFFLEIFTILRILKTKDLSRIMTRVTGKAEEWRRGGSVERALVENWSYPTGMVWCPMKMSGMAVI